MAILKDTIIDGTLTASKLGVPFIQSVETSDTENGGNTYLNVAPNGTTLSLDFYNLRGATGPQGATGNAGPRGFCGPSGYNGGFGACGPKGLCGPCGPSGNPGGKGVCGPCGPSGYTGYCGPSGKAGTNSKGLTSCTVNNGLPTLSTGTPSTSLTQIGSFNKSNAVVQGSLRFWNLSNSASTQLKIQFEQSGTTTASSTFTLAAYETMILPFCYDLGSAAVYIKMQRTGGTAVDVNVYASWITFGY